MTQGIIGDIAHTACGTLYRRRHRRPCGTQRPKIGGHAFAHGCRCHRCVKLSMVSIHLTMATNTLVTLGDNLKKMDMSAEAAW